MRFPRRSIAGVCRAVAFVALLIPAARNAWQCSAVKTAIVPVQVAGMSWPREFACELHFMAPDLIPYPIAYEVIC